MKRFILNTTFFIVPFFILHAFNVFNYEQRGVEGDLARVGYLYSNPMPRGLIMSQYNLPIQFTLLSEIELSAKTKTDVVTIGDSFSEQDSAGYKNFLANNGTSVLHVDRFISGNNPIQTLVGLINSNLFDYIQTDYIVLQTSERDINNRTKNIDFENTIDWKLVSKKVNSSRREVPNYNFQFFSDATIKMPLNNFQYLFSSKPFFSKTYKVKSNNLNLFSNNPDDMLFYKDDIQKLTAKNDSLKTLKSISVLNDINDLLSRKNIKLIVIVSPDKYDLYYPYIKNKLEFLKPTFYSTYERADKKYKNVDTYRILSKSIATERDVYFYDDTHWSPKGAKIVAEELIDIINK